MNTNESDIYLFVWGELRKTRSRNEHFERVGAHLVGTAKAPGFALKALSVPFGVRRYRPVLVRSAANDSVKGELYQCPKAALSFADTVLFSPDYIRTNIDVSYKRSGDGLFTTGRFRTYWTTAWVHIFVNTVPTDAQTFSSVLQLDELEKPGGDDGTEDLSCRC